MFYLKSYLASSQPEQSFYWTGHEDRSGGLAGPQSQVKAFAAHGQEGTMHHSKCYPGYSGVFCSACRPGFYKYDYSYGECLPCMNAPKNAYYSMTGETSAMCDYECDGYLESVNTNPDCLDPIRLEYQKLGGTIPFLGALGIFMLLSVLIFSMLNYRG